MATSLSEQTADLSSCCVCMENYNKKKLKPKYLPCSHTFCLKCTKEMANLPPPGKVTCPLCKKVCKVPTDGSDCLPNNVYALHIIELNDKINSLESTVAERDSVVAEQGSVIATQANLLKNGQLWCVACKCLAKPNCQQLKHKTTDFGQDVKEFDVWLVELKTGAHQGIEKVDHGQGHLEQKMKQLQTKMEEGEGHRQKLLEIVANCEEMKQLPPLSKATVFMRKNLMQTFSELKQQVKKAEGFANGVIYAVTVQQVVKEDQFPETDDPSASLAVIEPVSADCDATATELEATETDAISEAAAVNDVENEQFLPSPSITASTEEDEMEKDDRRDQWDDSLLGAVALRIPNEVLAAASSPSTLRRLFSPDLMPAAIDTTPGDESTSQEQKTGAKRRRRRQHNRDEMQIIDDPSPYGFSVEWLGSSQQPLRSIDVLFNSTRPIYVLDFSPDGSFLVSGGEDKSVRLWNTREVVGGNANSRPIQMERQHGDFGVTYVAVSPNNRSIFSGGARDQTVLIHDIETSKLVRSVTTHFSPDRVYSSGNFKWSGTIGRISFQSGSEGNIFLPSIFWDTALRIYDARRPSNKSVIQFLKRQSSIASASFSPVDTNQLVSAERDGVYVFDIRKPKSHHQYLTVPTNDRVTGARYSYDGSRLSCSSSKSINVYDLLPGSKEWDGSDKVSFPLFPEITYGRFAGKEDELLVSLKGSQLFVWQLPGGRGHRTVLSPLLELSTGHQSNISSLSLSFNKSSGVLASSDGNGVIKLWVANQGI